MRGLHVVVAWHRSIALLSVSPETSMLFLENGFLGIEHESVGFSAGMTIHRDFHPFSLDICDIRQAIRVKVTLSRIRSLPFNAVSFGCMILVKVGE